MQAKGHTILHIFVDVESLQSSSTRGQVGALPPLLKDLKFKVEPALRFKTFYATTPFPSQTLLRPEKNIRLQDGVMVLPSHNVAPTSWQYLEIYRRPPYVDAVRRPTLPRLRQSAASNETLPPKATSPKKWRATLEIPIETPASLTPTFCSAVVSRQYSLLVRINVGGINGQVYVLESPLQLVYSPSENESLDLAEVAVEPDMTLLVSCEIN